MKLNLNLSWFSLFYLIAIAFLTLFLVIPVGSLIVQSVEIFSTSTQALFSDFIPYLLGVTLNTIQLALTVTALTVLISTPLAFLIVKFNIVGAGLLLGLLTIPLITPAFVSSFATIILLGRSGVITMALELIGIDVPNIYGFLGLVITQVLHAIPYGLIIIIGGLKTVPKHLEEESLSMGTSVLKTQYSIVLPYIAPHILMAAMMVFLTSMGDVGGPIIIGGSYKVISVEIYSNFISFMGDERIPIIFSAWTILLSFLLLFGINKLLKLTNVKHKFQVGIMTYHEPKAKTLGTALLVLMTVVFLLPYVAIVMHSFADIWIYDWLPENFTLENYNTVIHDTGPIRNTMILIFTVTPIIVVLGVIFAHMFKNEKKLAWFSYITLLPFVLPGVVIGVGLLQTYSNAKIGNTDFVSTILILIIAISVRRLPFVLKTIEAGFAKIDRTQEEAAESLGAKKFKAFMTVIFPQIKITLYSAVIIGIVKIVTELSSALILNPPGWQNMSLYIAYYVNEGFISRASAMAIFVILIVGIGTAISNTLSRREVSKYE